MEIECASAVSRVVVHARGALVTREITLPADLPMGAVDVAVPGITVAAQAGSVRAALEGSERVVSAVRSSVVMSGAEHRPGPTLKRVDELVARRARLEDELNVLLQRRTLLADFALGPRLRPHDSSKRERDVFDARFGETIAMARLLGQKLEELDERILRLERERRALVQETDAARLDDRQASTKERAGTEQPTRRAIVRITGEGAPGTLAITYAVGAARWWPTYTLRIEEGGDRATWTFEALVAQRTGEDWTAAALALSSADLVFDARLPELPSLRFGRAQPPKKRPPRPAPAGVDEMFAAYMAFRPAPSPAPEPAPAPRPSTVTGGGISVDKLKTMAPPAELSEEDEITTVHRPEPAKPPARAYHAPPGAMPVMPMAAAPMPMAPPPQQALARSRSAGPLGAIAGGFGGRAEAAEEQMAGDGFGYEPPEPELVAGEQWSDLDALVLAGPHEPRRGRLVAGAPGADPHSLERAGRALDSVAREAWIDPLQSRGMFDHRYEAGGRADVPSDGRVHRVGVATAPCNVLISWRTVPSESPEVYREANVINPFEQALLGGPVEVYLDGSLLAQTKMDRIDRGGTVWCGMGVDDRVKVARNVRVEEESAGLLGGSIAVTHSVGIELSSVIKDPIKVVVLERVPVTDDKNIEIKMVRSTPAPTAYDQSERGAPVRGGGRFEVAVTPGKKTPLEIVYRLVFSSKLDIVGGSRRG